MLIRMAWRNLWRNPRRTTVVLTAISIGIAGCLVAMAINLGMIAGMVDTAIRGGLAHLQIHNAGWDENPELEIRLEDGGKAIGRLLDTLPEVEHWAPRLRAQGLVASPRASVGIEIAGVDPLRESGVSIAADFISAGTWLTEPGRVVLGERLARRLNARVGSKIVLSVQDLNGELTGQAYRVGGLIQSNLRVLDDGVVFMELKDAQLLFGLDQAITEIAVLTSDRDGVDQLQRILENALGDGLEVRTWAQLEPLLVYMIDSFDSMAWVLYGAVFIAMAFGIANVLLMAVFERTREIGMMRAVGMSRGGVVGMVVIESGFVTLLGLGLGIVLALFGIWLIGDGIDISRWAGAIDAYGIDTLLKPVMRRSDLIAPIAIGAITAILSSLWPALRAGRAKPADALRQA
ncbi:MAG: FtsX-like permease family protein [Myxococcota bacterium]